MEMLGKIRRMYFRDKLSLHQIAKRTGLLCQLRVSNQCWWRWSWYLNREV
ncbi:hypothetical protein [Pseudomonas avellanae]|nr:hypothetical protein [Pseudomonas avellanae]UQW77189.1 hypothetical protein L2Y01_28205 [Pseudomonas avellanae]